MGTEIDNTTDNTVQIRLFFFFFSSKFCMWLNISVFLLSSFFFCYNPVTGVGPPLASRSLESKLLLLDKNLATITHTFLSSGWATEQLLLDGDEHHNLLDSFSLTETLPFVLCLTLILVNNSNALLWKRLCSTTRVFIHNQECLP